MEDDEQIACDPSIMEIEPSSPHGMIHSKMRAHLFGAFARLQAFLKLFIKRLKLKQLLLVVVSIVVFM